MERAADPIDFQTFLELTGNRELVESAIANQEIAPLPRGIALRLANLVRIHMATGGLPDAVETWIRTHDFPQVDRVIDARVQQLVLASAAELHLDIPRCETLWQRIPRHVARENSHFRHSRHSEESEGLNLDPLLILLVQAGWMRRIRRLDHPAQVVEPYVYQSQYKYYLADTAMLRRLARLGATTVDEEKPELSRFRGTLTESYLLGILGPLCEEDVWYWKSGSLAEVDFIVRLQGELLPVEVKTARNVKSHSLALYRRLYRPRLALRYSLLNLKMDDDLLNIPIYLAHHTPRLMALALTRSP